MCNDITKELHQRLKFCIELFLLLLLLTSINEGYYCYKTKKKLAFKQIIIYIVLNASNLAY